MTDLFDRDEVEFTAFKKLIRSGGDSSGAIPAREPQTDRASFFDKLNEWARSEGAGGLGYLGFRAKSEGLSSVEVQLLSKGLQQRDVKSASRACGRINSQMD